MSRLSYDECFLTLLDHLAARSTCARRAVGALFVDEQHHILSTGYNGNIIGRPHCIDTPCMGRFDVPGDTARCEAVHAEQNAILQCFRLDLLHTAYISCSPCYTCTKMLCNTRVRRIVCRELYADAQGLALLQERKIELVIL